MTVSSAFLILFIVIISSLMFAVGKLEESVIANIFFAVIGFAGGLFTNKEKNTDRN